MLPDFLKNTNILFRVMRQEDLELIFNSKGIKIASYGRIDWDFHKTHKAYSNYNELAARIGSHPGVSVIHFFNHLTDPVELSNTDISNYFFDIIYEDMDCWIFNEDWVIEKYHDDPCIRLHCCLRKVRREEVV